MNRNSSLLFACTVSALLITGDLLALPSKGALELTGVPSSVMKDAEAALESYLQLEKLHEEAETEGEEGGVSSEKIRGVVYKLELASSKAQKSPELHYYLARAYRIAEKYSKAKRSIDKAIRIRKDFPEAIVQRGDLLYYTKDYKKALKEYDRALELVPEHAEALQSKGIVSLTLGQIDEAIEFIEAAEKISKSKLRQQYLKRLHELKVGPKWENTYRHESENYIIHTSVSSRYAREMAEAAERIRLAYTRVFPATKRPDRKYDVYIHASAEEYMANGGPPNTGGYYSPFSRRLVLFQRASADTLVTLNHEAFHQFIHDYIESTPQWFNEGVADYFGAFLYDREKQQLVPTENRMRVRTMQYAFRLKRLVDPAELMQMSRAEMYGRNVSFHYAQAWSMIWFMMHDRKGAPYRKVLVKYFQLLRKGKSGDEAYVATFGRINMEQFEKLWKASAGNLSFEQ